MADEPDVAWTPPVTNTLKCWIKSNISKCGGRTELQGKYGKLPGARNERNLSQRSMYELMRSSPLGFSWISKFPDAEQ